MSCCNQCFAVSFGLVNSRQVQGHVLCLPPNEGKKAAWAFGKSPMLIDNRWEAREAVKTHLDGKGEQVWMIDGEYFTVGQAGQASEASPTS